MRAVGEVSAGEVDVRSSRSPVSGVPQDVERDGLQQLKVKERSLNGL